MTEDYNANEKHSLKNGRHDFGIDNNEHSKKSSVVFRRSSGRKKLKWAVIVCIILFVLLLIMIVLNVLTLSKLNRKGHVEKVCTTRQCVEISARILSYMDREIDPCEDFYQYSCGGWLRDNFIPKEKVNWDIFEMLIDANNRLIKDIFQTFGSNTKLRRIDSNIDKLLTLYESCINTSSLTSTQPLLNLINNELGGSKITDASWDSQNWKYIDYLGRVENYVKRTPGYNLKVVPFVDSKAIADPYNSKQHILEIGPPTLGMMEASHYKNNASKPLRDIYMNVSINIAILLGVEKSAAREMMTKVFELESKLATILPTKTELRDIKKMQDRMTIEELTMKTDNKFDWLAYVNSLLTICGDSFTKDHVVIVKGTDFMKRVVDLIENTPKEVMANYFTWTIIQTYIDALPIAIQETYSMYTKLSLNTLEEKSRWETCIAVCKSYMGMALGSVVVQKSFKEEMKEEVKYLVTKVKDAFRETIDENTWMDGQTKAQATKKLNNMLENIAYPAFIINRNELAKLYTGLEVYPNELFNNLFDIIKLERKQNLDLINMKVERETWVLPPIYVNAFYDTNRNKMVFFAGILKPPFYSWQGPKSINFGGIGMVMGHEMIHGFDDQGRQYDDNGEWRNWWSNESAANFQRKSKCFVDQYSSYSRYGHHANGILALGENIADNGGLKISFRAYKHWLEDEGPDLVLPAVNLTNEQLFFVASSQIWCSKDRKANFINSLKYDIHTPGIFRVKGMLSNSEDFAKAFNCKKNSVMNPQKKCDLY